MSALNPAQTPSHFFQNNEGLPYRELCLVKKALKEKKFQKVYAKGYFSPQNRETLDESEKFGSLDSPDVPLVIQKKLIRSLGMEKKVNEHLRQSDGFLKNIGYPKNLRLSSDVIKESINNFRQAKRVNQIDHLKYNPALDTIGVKKLYDGVYKLNEKDTHQETTQPCIERIVKNRTYLNNSVHLYELHDVTSYQQKRALQEYRLSQIPPEKKHDSLMKQLMHQVVVIDGETLTSPKQRVTVKDYVQKKMKVLEPDPHKAFDLFLARIDRADEQVPPNFRKDYEDQELQNKILRKQKIQTTQTRLVNQLLSSAQKQISQSLQGNILNHLRLQNLNSGLNTELPSFRTVSQTPTMLPSLVDKSVDTQKPFSFMQAMASLGSTDISRKELQQETSRSQLQYENETVITDLPINFDISLAPTDLRQRKIKPSALNFNYQEYEILMMNHRYKNSQSESKRVSVVNDYNTTDIKSNEFGSLKKNARYIMFQCQKDHFVKESNNLTLQMDNLQNQVDKHAESQTELLDKYIDLTTQTEQVKIFPINALREEHKMNKQNNFDAFLSPQAIKEAKNIDKRAIISIIRNKKKTLWKPSRLKLGKEIKYEIDRLMSNTAQ